MEKFLKHKTTELKPTDEIFLRLLSSKSSIFPPDEEKCREKKLLQESRQLGYEKDFAQAQCKFEAAEKLKLTIALKAKEFTDATKALNTAKRRLSATIDAYEYAKAQSWDEIIVHLEGRLYDYHKAVEEKEKLLPFAGFAFWKPVTPLTTKPPLLYLSISLTKNFPTNFMSRKIYPLGFLQEGL